MGAVPLGLLRHKVSIRPYTGTTSLGKQYGTSFLSMAFVADGNTMVRDSNGNQVVSSSTVILPLNTNCPVGSEMTTPTKTAFVLATNRRDAPGLPTPDHLEVKLG